MCIKHRIRMVQNLDCCAVMFQQYMRLGIYISQVALVVGQVCFPEVHEVVIPC